MSFFKKPVIWVSIVFIIIAVYFLFLRGGNQEPVFETATRKNILEEVSITGRVKPAEEVGLAFLYGGRVSQVLRGIGDRVKVGDLRRRPD